MFINSLDIFCQYERRTENLPVFLAKSCWCSLNMTCYLPTTHFEHMTISRACLVVIELWKSLTFFWCEHNSTTLIESIWNFSFHISPFHSASYTLPIKDFSFGHFNQICSINETFSKWNLLVEEKWNVKIIYWCLLAKTIKTTVNVKWPRVCIFSHVRPSYKWAVSNLVDP